MKNIILLLSFVSVLCLISCKKDDTKASTTPTTQTGTTPTATTPTTQTGTTPTATTPTPTATGTGTTPIEHFILYIPGIINTSVYPKYNLTFYKKDGRTNKTILFVTDYQCFKVDKKWLSQIKVNKTIKIKQTLPSGRATYSFSDKVIYEPGRSDYRVGIYKPDKNSDHLIKVGSVLKIGQFTWNRFVHISMGFYCQERNESVLCYKTLRYS